MPPGYAGGPAAAGSQMVAPPTGPGGTAIPEQGFWVERMRGLKMLGWGFALIVLNVASLVLSGTFYIISTLIMFPLFFGGGWQIVFGDEYDDQTHALVMWKRIGFYGAMGVGLLFGIATFAFLDGCI